MQGFRMGIRMNIYVGVVRENIDDNRTKISQNPRRFLT